MASSLAKYVYIFVTGIFLVNRDADRMGHISALCGKDVDKNFSPFVGDARFKIIISIILISEISPLSDYYSDNLRSAAIYSIS